MAGKFEEAYSQYQNQVNEYQDRYSRYKELLEQAVEEPGEFARQLGTELAAPFIAHMAQSGISKLFASRGANLLDLANTARSEAVDGVSDLSSEVPVSTDELPFPGVGTLTDTLKTAVTSKLAQLGESDLAQGLKQGVTGAVGRAVSALRGAGGDAENLVSQLVTSRIGTIAEGASKLGDVAGEAVQSGVSEASNVAQGLASSELVSRGTLIGTRVDEPSSVFGLRGTEDLDPEAGFADEPPASQATTNVIGRLIGQITGRNVATEAEEPVESIASQLGGRLGGGLQTDLSQAAQRVFDTVQSNINTVSKVTGAAEDVAEEAISEGATAIQGGSKIIGGVASDIGNIAAGAEATAGTVAGEVAGEATAEATAAATGPETGGIGFLVAGLIALGGTLASIFTHHSDAPDPVPIPNIPIPTFQAGLATDN